MATTVDAKAGAVPEGFPPNETLYIRNLPDQLPKRVLKRNLYMLFATYGVVLDVMARKTMPLRGQAHIVFLNIDSSTQAMRALQGFNFFGNDMEIDYAKEKSDTFQKLSGTFGIPKDPAAETAAQPTSVQAAVFGNQAAPTKAKPVNAPAAKEDEAKGTKRVREVESEEDDEEAAMDESDSD